LGKTYGSLNNRNMNNESSALRFQQGSSDKVYNVELIHNRMGWVVNFEYGRRGSSLTRGTKIGPTVNYTMAKRTYDKLVTSKKAKGYQLVGQSSPNVNLITTAPIKKVKTNAGIYPQLLNEITREEALAFINNDDYCLQEKFDGRRRMIIRNRLEVVISGVNKKGLLLPLTPEIESAAITLGEDYIIDGEDMGDCIMLFDNITEPNLTYKERFNLLESTSPELKVVKTAWNTNTKQIMFDRLIRERAEGVVFKNIHAPYKPGRPASGGGQYKCKFYESASCIVASVSDIKSSIGLKVYDDSNPVSLVGVPVGNATLYPNSPVVKVGDIVEIKYLYYYEGGSLYQPVLKDVRDDVDASECTLAKLKRKKDDQSINN
jgi:bifunctional non-homologous end joining protein LigD